jgi:hypothetical protein
MPRLGRAQRLKFSKPCRGLLPADRLMLALGPRKVRRYSGLKERNRFTLIKAR